MISKNNISSDKKSYYQFNTDLFLCKVKLLDMRSENAICTSACDVPKRDKLFKMAQKMQMYNENEYHNRSPGVPQGSQDYGLSSPNDERNAV